MHRLKADARSYITTLESRVDVAHIVSTYAEFLILLPSFLLESGIALPG